MSDIMQRLRALASRPPRRQARKKKRAARKAMLPQPPPLTERDRVALAEYDATVRKNLATHDPARLRRYNQAIKRQARKGR